MEIPDEYWRLSTRWKLFGAIAVALPLVNIYWMAPSFASLIEPHRDMRRSSGEVRPTEASGKDDNRMTEHEWASEALDPSSTLQLGAYALRFERVIEAPRSVVCRAWTEPERLREWYRPDDAWSTPVAEIDLRIGGVRDLGRPLGNAARRPGAVGGRL